MLWIPRQVGNTLFQLLKLIAMSQTRSGTTYSPLEIPEIFQASPLFDLPILLQKAAKDSNGKVDIEDTYAQATIPEVPQMPGPDNPFAHLMPLEHPIHTTSRSHQKRRRAREQRVLDQGHSATPRALRKIVNPTHKISTPLKSESLPVARGGYSAIRGTFVGAKTMHSLESLSVLGIRVVPWNGM